MLTTIRKAFNPVLSPTAKYVGYGNQHAYVLVLGTEKVVDFGGIDNGEAGVSVVGWWDEETVALAFQLPGNHRRLELHNMVTDEREVRADIPTAQCPGLNGQRAVANGRVFCSVPAAFVGQPGGGFRFFLDGQDITPAVAGEHADRGQAIFDGTHYAYSVPDAVPWRWIVRRVSDQGLVQAYAPRQWWMHLVLQTAPDGSHRLHAIGETGVVINGAAHDLPGETRGGSTWTNGEELVWTCAHSLGRPHVVGRPAARLNAAEPAVVVPDMLHVGLDLKVNAGREFVCAATEQASGLMTLATIPVTGQRAAFERRPDPLPPIAVPDMPPVLVGYLTDDPDAPGNTGGSLTEKPVLHEGFKQADGAPWWKADEEPRLRLLFVDPQESHAPDAEEANAFAAQDRTKAWLAYYCDRPRVSPDVLERARRAKAAGRNVVLGLRAYPAAVEGRPASEDSVAQMVARIDADIAAHRAEFPKMALYAPNYDQSGHWPVALVCQFVQASAELVARHRDVFVSLSFFGWKRPPVHEAIEKATTSVCRAVPAPDVDALLPRDARRAPQNVTPPAPAPRAATPAAPAAPAPRAAPSGVAPAPTPAGGAGTPKKTDAKPKPPPGTFNIDDFKIGNRKPK
jgi:hypothetical protein